MIVAYQKVELAEVCLPFEAAEWVAFGRLPSTYLGEFKGERFDREVREVRNEIQALTSGEYWLSRDPIYWQGEIEAAGLDVDFSTYIEAIVSPGFRSLNELFFGTVEDQRFDGSGVVPFGPPSPSDFEKVELVEEVHEAMTFHEERAQMAVLMALMDGRLSAKGFAVPDGWYRDEEGNWLPEDDYEDGEEYAWNAPFDRAVVQSIPQTLWRNSAAPWEINCTGEGPGNFIGAWIEVANLLEVFPEPHLPPREAASARHYGETLVVNSRSDKQAGPVRKGRGRPKKADGLLQTAVQNEFARRAKFGEIPAQREALIADCIEWVNQIFGQSISRTSAQRYLAAIRSAQK